MENPYYFGSEIMIKKIHNIILLSFCLLTLLSCIKKDKTPYLIVISFDGYRHNYSDSIDTPHFKFVEEHGFRAKGLIPAFPSMTFPNHYSIVTGQFPTNHGIVSNNFFAPDLCLQYKISDTVSVYNQEFYQSKPLWKVGMDQGIKTASYFWVGSEAILADYYHKYKTATPYEKRLKEFDRWLNLPYSERPKIIFLYFEDVDNKGHWYGPESNENKLAVQKADSTLGRILHIVNQSGLKDSTHMIIASDHGMTTFNDDPINLKPLYDILPASVIKTESYSLVSLYVPQSMSIDSLFSIIPDIPNTEKHIRSQSPVHWNVQPSGRLGDIIISANPGFIFSYENRKFSRSKGGHGYDELFPDMWGIFYAIGPNIKSKSTTDLVNITDIFPFALHLLDLPYEGKIDGKITPELSEVFKRKPQIK